MGLNTIPIVFDKSHLTTIGTRLYAESLDLVRELVANAYDADATQVDITLGEAEMIISDNGSGMDRDGLTQYFTIGSDFKKKNPLTPVFGRSRIGEFGIGKFAVLSLCNRFSIFTKKDGYGATVVFDKDQFEASSNWEVPIIEQPVNRAKNGTKVSLSDLKYVISGDLLERKLRQQIPLGQKDFSVYINSIKLAPSAVPGHKYKIREQTPYGLILGEITISSLLLPFEQCGVAIKVKGMTIKREMFGLDSHHKMTSRRITGEINADFLIPTSSRDNFLKENPEFNTFYEVMLKKVKKIARDMEKSSLSRLDLKTDQALSNALQKVRSALKKNPDIFLMHDLPLFTGASATSGKELEKNLMTTKMGNGKNKHKVKMPSNSSGIVKEIKNREHKTLVRTILKDKNRIVKKIKIGGMNLTCSLSGLGADNVESFVEGGIIFINRDHPLFKVAEKEPELSSYHLMRLITQELIKLANPLDISQAYDWQSRLLTSAVVGEIKNRN